MVCVVRHRCEAAGAASQRAVCGGWTRLRPPRAEFSRYEIRRALRIASDASSGPRRAAASLRNTESFWAAARPWKERFAPSSSWLAHLSRIAAVSRKNWRQEVSFYTYVHPGTITR